MKANMKRIDVGNDAYYNVVENVWQGVKTDADGVTFQYYNQHGYTQYRIEYPYNGMENTLPEWFLIRYKDPRYGVERIAGGLDFCADGLICVATHNAYFKTIQAAMLFIEEMYPDFIIHVEDPHYDYPSED